MTGKVVTTYSSHGHLASNVTNVENEAVPFASDRYSPVEVATAVTFTVAMIEVITLFLSSQPIGATHLVPFSCPAGNVRAAVGSDSVAPGGQSCQRIHHRCGDPRFHVPGEGPFRAEKPAPTKGHLQTDPCEYENVCNVRNSGVGWMHQ